MISVSIQMRQNQVPFGQLKELGKKSPKNGKTSKVYSIFKLVDQVINI